VLQAQRHHLRSLLAGEVLDAAGVLLPPKPLGSALLLRRPWAQLLRLVLQLGLPAEALMVLKGPSRWGAPLRAPFRQRCAEGAAAHAAAVHCDP
jgi:hypothetical protein